MNTYKYTKIVVHCCQKRPKTGFCAPLKSQVGERVPGKRITEKPADGARIRLNQKLSPDPAPIVSVDVAVAESCNAVLRAEGNQPAHICTLNWFICRKKDRGSL